MSDLPDFKAYCADACVKLWGEPERKTQKEWRWGNNSYAYKSYNVRKRCWYDASAECGGSTLELAQLARGKTVEKLRGAAFFDAWQYAYDQRWLPDAPPEKKPNGKGGEQLSIHATYPYHDESGELLFEVVRFDTTNPDQRFRHRQPDGKGDWLWSIKGVRRVLYRLPQLIAAVKSGQRVLVSEGERDANTAVKLGYAATTMPGGVDKWLSQYDAHFVDASDVVIVSDNDQQAKDPKTGKMQFHPDGRPVLKGQDHAAKLAKRLSKLAKRVRVIMFDVKDLTAWVEAGGTREQLDALIEQAPQHKAPHADEKPTEDITTQIAPQSALPELIIDGSDLTGTAKQLAKLFAVHRRFLFNGHEPIEIVAEIGMPRAIPVTPESVRVFAHEICIPVKIVKGETIRATLSKDIANLYLRGLQGRWGLKPFNGITTSPILASDGSFRTNSGYDEATGLWCHQIPAVDVPERPTRAQARVSLDALRHFFRTFVFADAETIRDNILGVDVVNPKANIGLDESSFLVSLMTGVCRASLILAPGILATAPAFSGAGTGKGLATKAICIIASGAPPSAFTSGHDAEEMDKRLTAALTEARPAIFLDNYNGKDLTSDILASTLTENPCEVRPMGHTAMVKLHTRTLVAMTGNDVQIAEDMARRLVKTDYDAKVENPELRPFKPGFLDTVHEKRATLLGHALTIWRWGRQNAGVITQGKPLGSYEVWAQWCRDPLVNLGVRDPVDRIAAIKAADPKRKRIQTVFEAWWTAHRDLLLPAKDLDQSVIQVIDEKSGFRDGEFRYSRQFVARWLQSHINTRVGGYVLTNVPIGTGNRPISHYKVQITSTGST